MAGADRRSVLIGAGALAASPALATADPLSGNALYADVKAYAALGAHRTGSPGDAAATAWLERALRAAGYRTERQGFDFPVFEFTQVYAEVGSRRLDAFPVWTPIVTPAAGVAGPLRRDGGAGAVALVVLPAGSGGPLGPQPWRAEVTKAIASGAVGVLVVTRNPVGEFSALNSEPDQPPWRVPVIGVAGREEGALTAALGREVRLVLRGRTVTRRAENVVGRQDGRGKPLVISTPKSGWMTCAGERGSGLAIWLGLARHLAARGRRLVLTANSGHEFDGYGGHLFAERLAPKPAEAAGWVHIGANVAAYDFALRDGRVTRLDRPQASRRLTVSEPLMAVARRAFAGQPQYADPIDIDREAAPGEVATYQRLGYAPLVGIVGSHPLHHTPRDLPDVTGPELLEPVARGLAAVIDTL